MSNTKKIIAIALTLLLITAIFTACSKKAEEKPSDVTNRESSSSPVIDVNSPSSSEETGTTAPVEAVEEDTKDNTPAKKPEASTSAAKPANAVPATSNPSTTAGKTPSTTVKPTTTKPASTTSTTTKPTSSSAFEIGSSAKDENGDIWFG